jgi:hypothetical protein
MLSSQAAINARGYIHRTGFEETGNPCRRDPKVDSYPPDLICRKQSALRFPLAERLNLYRTVILTLYAHDPFFGHSRT